MSAERTILRTADGDAPRARARHSWPQSRQLTSAAARVADAVHDAVSRGELRAGRRGRVPELRLATRPSGPHTPRVRRPSRTSELRREL
jgi:hypothetical protein